MPTGKSAFAHHLAHEIGIDVLQKRGSDLIKPYVGQTEAAIAGAFTEAKRAGALLLIDEADDFLTDRRDIAHSWERTMVAEVLRWMEHLEAPFVATTNLADKLDPVAQRRFTIRADFFALEPEQSASLFHRYFGEPLPERHLLRNQTPGDFEVVARRAELLGEKNLSACLAGCRQKPNCVVTLANLSAFSQDVGLFARVFCSVVTLKSSYRSSFQSLKLLTAKRLN